MAFEVEFLVDTRGRAERTHPPVLFSERDRLKALVVGAHPNRTCARDATTEDVPVAAPTDGVIEVPFPTLVDDIRSVVLDPAHRER